ncbi:carbohydrate binding family 9 domain-containing protein, partial [Haliea sp. AH-315-K21]|nr:carbohydrate binding family 9 domain-containing protein [Haliea sp. AH-315-K21]
MLIIPQLSQAQLETVGSFVTQTSDSKIIEINKTNLAPILDGILDDPIWREARKITNFHQVQPVDHGEPTEISEFYITYDDNNFYMAARLYDSNPSQIRARQLIQGQNIFGDDTADILLDTFNNDRTAFYFQTNPNGVRSEGVWESASSYNNDWSGIWQVESSIDDQGWTTEMIIPFTTLNFDPNTDEWGLNLGRSIARKNERIYWSSFNRSTNPATAGQVVGINDIQQGLGLDIAPSFTMAQVEDHVAGSSDNRVDPSLDVFYKFTPNLTGALTLNTDFSATEVDDRQVNLTRFSLFFPEKRDFFLQDSEIFSFGNIGGSGGGNAPPGAKLRNGIPFYSRRIGLNPVTGQPVDIDVGGKLAGRVGNLSLGALAIQQGDRLGLEGQDVFVGRITSNILSESRIGAIFTEGDPNSNIDNSLVGVDFTYRNTQFSDSHTLSSDLWYQQSDTQGLDGDDKAYNANINYSTQGTGASLEVDYSYVGDQYNPSLGFANRKGIERAAFSSNYRYFLNSHPFIRNLTFVFRGDHIRDAETGAMQSQFVQFNPIAFDTNRGDLVFIMLQNDKEGLAQPFEIRPGIFIPAGEYSFNYAQLMIRSSRNRTFAPNFIYREGKFYNGNSKVINAGFSWNPNRNLSIDFSYNYTDASLPVGDF